MIRMPHVHSNISMTAKLGLSIVNFTDSWDSVAVRSILSSRWSFLLSFWRQKTTLLKFF
jgi:hypothetical protein